MILYLNGQDIRRLVLGSVDDRTVTLFECDPDDYLSVIAGYLESIGQSIEDLTALAVIVGPGSPTAIRSSLAIANTLAFVKRLPTLPLEKDPAVDDVEFIKSIDLATLEQRAGLLKPVYLHPPNITLPNNS